VVLFWAISVGAGAAVSGADVVDWEKRAAPPGERMTNKTVRRTVARKLLI
jgi:hypothetical protein